MYLCKRGVCVYVPGGNTASASLPIGPWNLEWQQPCLCQRTGSKMMCFPLIYSLCITTIQPSIFFPHSLTHSLFMLRAQCQEQLVCWRDMLEHMDAGTNPCEYQENQTFSYLISHWPGPESMEIGSWQLWVSTTCAQLSMGRNNCLSSIHSDSRKIGHVTAALTNVLIIELNLSLAVFAMNEIWLLSSGLMRSWKFQNNR